MSARLVVALVLLTACSGRPTPKKAEKERERASSGVTSAGMIADAWDSGAAPAAYASHAIRDISTSLLQARARPVWAALPPPARAALVGELGTLHGVTAAMDSAISRRDREGAHALRGALADHGRALDAVPIDTAGQ